MKYLETKRVEREEDTRIVKDIMKVMKESEDYFEEYAIFGPSTDQKKS